jgi:hypothetical protein
MTIRTESAKPERQEKICERPTAEVLSSGKLANFSGPLCEGKKLTSSPSPSSPPPPAGHESWGAAGQPPPERLPSMSADLSCPAASSQSGSCNPFGDSESLAPTTLLGEEEEGEESVYSLSPRSSALYPEGEGGAGSGIYRPLVYHIPGKRRAPPPPGNVKRPLSPASTCSETSSQRDSRIYGRRKGPAPPPPIPTHPPPPEVGLKRKCLFYCCENAFFPQLSANF